MYFHDVKIYYLDVKIYFQSLKIYFQGMKIANPAWQGEFCIQSCDDFGQEKSVFALWFGKISVTLQRIK